MLWYVYFKYPIKCYVTVFRSCITTTIFSYACVCSEPEGCIEGSVRLSSGDIEQEGIPEVCVNGVWGSICDNGWSSIDGIVLCRQLGYDDIGIAINGIRIGPIGMMHTCILQIALFYALNSSSSLFKLILWRWRRSHCLELPLLQWIGEQHLTVFKISVSLLLLLQK